MEPKQHIISSIPLGIGYYLISKDITSALIAVGITNIIDIDHVLEYVIVNKKISSLKNMRKSFVTCDTYRKFYFFLHSWELLILLSICLFFNPNPYLTAVIIGYVYHLIPDQIYNTKLKGARNVKPPFYFFIYRMNHNFVWRFMFMRLNTTRN